MTNRCVKKQHLSVRHELCDVRDIDDSRNPVLSSDDGAMARRIGDRMAGFLNVYARGGCRMPVLHDDEAVGDSRSHTILKRCRHARRGFAGSDREDPVIA